MFYRKSDLFDKLV